MGDLIVIVILVVLCGVALYYMWKKRTYSSCSGNCSSCGSDCHLSENLKKARAELAQERLNKGKEN